MALSQREKSYAVAVGVIVASVGLWSFVISPYRDAMTDLDNQLQKAIAKKQADENTFARQQQLNKVWRDMQSNGLKLDPAVAQSQAYHAVLDWAQNAGVQLDSTKLERPTDANAFEVIRFSISGPASFRNTSRLLWALETSPIPLRVNQLTLHARQNGSDDLAMQLDISTLCLMPTDSSSSAGAVAQAFGGAQ